MGIRLYLAGSNNLPRLGTVQKSAPIASGIPAVLPELVPLGTSVIPDKSPELDPPISEQGFCLIPRITPRLVVESLQSLNMIRDIAIFLSLHQE